MEVKVNPPIRRSILKQNGVVVLGLTVVMFAFLNKDFCVFVCRFALFVTSVSLFDNANKVLMDTD